MIKKIAFYVAVYSVSVVALCLTISVLGGFLIGSLISNFIKTLQGGVMLIYTDFKPTFVDMFFILCGFSFYGQRHNLKQKSELCSFRGNIDNDFI